MTDDKFILMGLNDENSKDVAEVLRNPTCKKLLDFLGDTKEASEKDIADGLDMPINTAEYNLKKLVKSGLVVKTKNFFWSVKGKKIPMYKLARKHIIISPNKKPSLSYLKSILPIVLVMAGLMAIIALFFLNNNPLQGSDDGEVNYDQIKQFKSLEDLQAYIKQNVDNTGYSGGIFNNFAGREVMTTTSAESLDVSTGSSGAAPKAAVDSGATDFSTTNIQVEGVDEADIVKNDGKYIYVVTNGKIVIVEAYPAADMQVLSEITNISGVRDILLYEDKLIVLSNDYNYVSYNEGCIGEGITGVKCGGGYSRNTAFVSVYDVSDKEDPQLENKYGIEGNYVQSRMIGDKVYIIATKYIRSDNPEPPIILENDQESVVAPRDIFYWDYPANNYVFTTVAAIDVKGSFNKDIDGQFNKKTYLTGSSWTVYVSENNIYLTGQKYVSYKTFFEEMFEEVYLPMFSGNIEDEIKEIWESGNETYQKINQINKIVQEYSMSLTGDERDEFDSKLEKGLEEFQIKFEKEREKTVIHKIAINGMSIKYKDVGMVPGRLLNQFSMDEFDGYFRVATTTGSMWGSTSLNHVYVLDSGLEIVGSVNDLAKGERIYSARFIGKRLYLVTFRQIDPFYVIDLEDPENPSVLGYLKIPGYSSYLHPYDENHVIGLGMNGSNVKLSLFDVTDVENPTEIDNYVVPGRYSGSDALHDHKAFLFDKAKGLLVIPVNYNEIVGTETNEFGFVRNIYKYWQGAFVFNVDLENGFNLDAKISHDEGDNENRYYSNDYVRRSLYMDDVLYTISNYKVKASNLDDFSNINTISIAEKLNYGRYTTFVDDVDVVSAADVVAVLE